MQYASDKTIPLCASSEAESFIFWEDSSTNNISPDMFRRYSAPEIARCTCFNASKGDPFAMIDAAKAAGLEKIQISHPSREVIAYAHEMGLVVNICFADTAQQAEEMLSMGADTLMSNSILEVIPVLEK